MFALRSARSAELATFLLGLARFAEPVANS